MELLLYERTDRVPLLPKGATGQTTGCAYCAVGCGYKVYTWPVGTAGGPAAKENAFGENFPTGFEGVWVGPNQHTVVSVGGKPHHCVVIPDPDATAVNYRYKLGKAKLARLGESPYKTDRRFLTFQRRDFTG